MTASRCSQCAKPVIARGLCWACYGRARRRGELESHVKGEAYADTGCDLHAACLTCPFFACRYDLAGGVDELRRRQPLIELQRTGARA